MAERKQLSRRAAISSAGAAIGAPSSNKNAVSFRKANGKAELDELEGRLGLVSMRRPPREFATISQKESHALTRESDAELLSVMRELGISATGQQETEEPHHRALSSRPGTLNQSTQQRLDGVELEMASDEAWLSSVLQFGQLEKAHAAIENGDADTAAQLFSAFLGSTALSIPEITNQCGHIVESDELGMNFGRPDSILNLGSESGDAGITGESFCRSAFKKVPSPCDSGILKDELGIGSVAPNARDEKLLEHSGRVRTTCPKGHTMVQRPSDGWDYCNECTYRPPSWCGGPDRIPFYHCYACRGFSLCGDCSGLAEETLSKAPSPEYTAWQALRRLVANVQEDPQLDLSGTSFQLPGSGCGAVGIELYAFVVGAVVRQNVSQGTLFVCGAAATAGALNACTEKLPMKKQRLQLGWQELLFQHFQDKLKIKVRDAGGNPASWKVGKPHIRQVIESFPGMRTRDLISQEEAAPKNRAAAWKLLVTTLRQPNTCVYFHTRNGWSGHYTLVSGAVGIAPAPNTTSGMEVPLYSEEHSAILTNQVAQEPMQRVSFRKVCETMIKTKGFFRMFVVEYRPRGR